MNGINPIAGVQQQPVITPQASMATGNQPMMAPAAGLDPQILAAAIRQMGDNMQQGQNGPQDSSGPNQG